MGTEFEKGKQLYRAIQDGMLEEYNCDIDDFDTLTLDEQQGYQLAAENYEAWLSETADLGRV